MRLMSFLGRPILIFVYFFVALISLKFELRDVGKAIAWYLMLSEARPNQLSTINIQLLWLLAFVLLWYVIWAVEAALISDHLNIIAA
jgi:hypothetical protein